MATDPTNLVGEGDTSVTDTAQTDTGVAAEALNEAEPQYDAEGNLVPPPEEDEEVELDDDLKLTVPKTAAQKLKELKEGNLRQADYTRKTQELADARKAFDAQAQQAQQASQAERQTEAAILAMDAQLAQFANVNWAAEMQAAEANFDDGAKARIQAAFMQYNQLKDARGNAAAQYFGLRQQRESQQQQETARLVGEGRAAVAKIPGWSEQVGTELKAIAMSPEIGFSADEIGDEISINPKVARALMLAKEALDTRRKAKATQNLAASQGIQPIPSVKGSSGATPVRADTNDFKAFEKLASRELAKG